MCTGLADTGGYGAALDGRHGLKPLLTAHATADSAPAGRTGPGLQPSAARWPSSGRIGERGDGVGEFVGVGEDGCGERDRVGVVAPDGVFVEEEVGVVEDRQVAEAVLGEPGAEGVVGVPVSRDAGVGEQVVGDGAFLVGGECAGPYGVDLDGQRGVLGEDVL